MSLCVRTRLLLLPTASVSRLERVPQGLAIKQHLLMGNAEIKFILSKHSIPQHHTVHQSIRRPRHPALIAPLHMIPRIWLQRLKDGGLIWRVANIAFITFFTKGKKTHTGRTQPLEHRCRGTQEKVALSFPCVSTQALSNYSP